jgi:hypothetical protein
MTLICRYAFDIPLHEILFFGEATTRNTSGRSSGIECLRDVVDESLVIPKESAVSRLEGAVEVVGLNVCDVVGCEMPYSKESAVAYLLSGSGA